MYQASRITVEKKCIGHVQKKGGHSTSEVEAPGTGREGQLTDRTVDKLQNYYGITVRANVGNLAGMRKRHACQFHAPCFPRVPPLWQHKLLQVPVR